MARPLEGLTVLVVEDDDELRALTKMVLEDEGADVRDASGGLEAKALLDAGCAPGVALLDARLPDSSGNAVSEELRDARAACVQVLVSGDADAVDRWRRLGGFALAKPYDIEELVQLVTRAAGRRVVA